MCTKNIIFPYTYFLRKFIPYFLSNEKISCFREKNTIFPDNTRKIMSQRGPFKNTFFSEDLKKISYFLVFFWKRSSFIFRLRLRSYFRERETWSFPIIRERSYSSAIFLERPSFQDVWKKKIWFSVQCQSLSSKINIKWKKFISLVTCRI